MDFKTQRAWQTPDITSQHRMPAHTPLSSWRDADAAKIDAVSDAILSLDGTWQFALFDSVEAVPNAWPAPLPNMSDMTVPGHWQLQGFDHPIYTNVQFPFPCNPPIVPDANPTGCYQRSFSMPSTWSNEAQIRILFEGVDSAFHLVQRAVGRLLPRQSLTGRIRFKSFHCCRAKYAQCFGSAAL